MDKSKILANIVERKSLYFTVSFESQEVRKKFLSDLPDGYESRIKGDFSLVLLDVIPDHIPVDDDSEARYFRNATTHAERHAPCHDSDHQESYDPYDGSTW